MLLITCPLERLSHRSGPCGNSECSSSILSRKGGSSRAAPIDSVSPTACKFIKFSQWNNNIHCWTIQCGIGFTFLRLKTHSVQLGYNASPVSIYMYWRTVGAKLYPAMLSIMAKTKLGTHQSLQCSQTLRIMHPENFQVNNFSEKNLRII